MSLAKQLLRTNSLVNPSRKNNLIVFCARETATVATDDSNRQDSHLANAKSFDEMPGPTRLPYIGSAWTYFPLVGRYKTSMLHLATSHKHQVYGDVVREQFGHLNIVTSYRPEDLEHLMRNEGKYPSRGEFSTLKAYRESRKQWYSTTGILVMNGKEWHDLRSKVQPHLMKPKNILAFLEPMQDVARDLIIRMKYTRDQNKEVPDLLKELYKWALESVALVGLDARLGCLDNNLSPKSDGSNMIKSVQIMFECINKLEAFTGNIQYWKYFNTPMWKKFTQAGDVFSEIAHKYINKALDALKNVSEDKELTLLQSMIATKGLAASGAMVTVTDMLMAGIDTTSHTVGFLLYHLAKNPDKQNLLHEEVKKLLPSKSDRVTQSVFNELRYLKCCMKEAARIHPIVSGVGRTIYDHDIVISGYRVPAGTTVLVATQIVCQQEKYFKNANTFLPERWLNKDENVHPFSYMPFGFGPRSCIGRRLAELEMICLIVEIVRNFKVEYHHEDIGMYTRLINTPNKPLRFNFIDR